MTRTMPFWSLLMITQLLLSTSAAGLGIDFSLINSNGSGELDASSLL